MEAHRLVCFCHLGRIASLILSLVLPLFLSFSHSKTPIQFTPKCEKSFAYTQKLCQCCHKWHPIPALHQCVRAGGGVPSCFVFECVYVVYCCWFVCYCVCICLFVTSFLQKDFSMDLISGESNSMVLFTRTDPGPLRASL